MFVIDEISSHGGTNRTQRVTIKELYHFIQDFLFGFSYANTIVR